MSREADACRPDRSMRSADHPLPGPALPALAREFRAIGLPDSRSLAP